MWLRKSTASQYILLGPFLDDTDGKTPETGLTINGSDIKLWKEGTNVEVNKNSTGATHIAGGRYYALLDATDTNTLGKLEINVHMAGALPVRREFMVLPVNAYDSLILGTDNLDVTTVDGTVTTLSNLPSIPAGWLTAAGIAASALNGKGDWNIGKTGYSLSQAFPSNFSSMSISAGGLVDITQAAADKAWGTSSRVLTAGTNISLAKGSGITGFNDLDAAGVAAATWNASTATYGSAGSYGALIETNLDAQVSTVGGGSLTAADIADAVWDEALSSHATAGSAGAGLTAAGSAGDPWATLIPGAYGAGTAGYIMGNNINATISSRLASSSYTAAPSAATVAGAVWDETLASHLTAGSTGAGLNAAGSAGDPWATSLPGAYGAGTAGKILGDNLNATVSSRASQTSVDTLTGYVDTEVGAIKAKTDYLPSATAGAAGGLFIAGSNAATSVNITGNLTGNVSGSVGSVTGAVGSVTGAVGSVTAGVTLAAATHTGAVIPTVTTLTNLPAITSGWLTATGIAAGALNGKGDWLNSAGVSAAVWNAATASYGSAGSYGLLIETNLDAQVSSVGGGGGTADWTADQRTAISAILGIPASGTTPTDPTTGILDTIRDLAVAVKAKTDNLPADPADASDISAAIGVTNGKVDAVQSDVDNIQTRIPAALVGGRMDSNIGAISNDTTTLSVFKRAVDGTCIGTVGGGSTTTSIVSSALTPAGSVLTQFKGRILTFDRNTTTVALRGQSTDITSSTASATPTFTVSALTTSPVSGDTFSIQ
jgi:hypothetical protein